MTKLILLEITYQRRVSRKSRKNKLIVRRDNIDGPYKNRIVSLPVDIRIGPDSGANLIVRELIAREIKKRTGEELTYYVRAEFEQFTPGTRKSTRYFKTIVGRTQFPV